MESKDGEAGPGGVAKLETAMAFDFTLAGKYSGYEVICRTASLDGLMPPRDGVIGTSIRNCYVER